MRSCREYGIVLGAWYICQRLHWSWKVVYLALVGCCFSRWNDPGKGRDVNSALFARLSICTFIVLHCRAAVEQLDGICMH